jgi:hypothetical protein
MSRDVLEDHQDYVRELAWRRNGLYALYRDKKLYYVGLASDLPNRLKSHLKDKHADGWDNFSLYLTTSGEHLRELEALLIRIARPHGNTAVMNVPEATDLRRWLRKRLNTDSRDKIKALFHDRRQKPRGTPDRRSKPRVLGQPSLQAYITKGMTLRMEYKGSRYTARVRKNGTIKLAGKKYNSPSLAARAIKGRSTNGWYDWRFQNATGEWVKLKELRA